MSKIKDVQVIFVEEIPAEKSGIGQDVPAHAKLEWKDKQGRRCSHLLELPEHMIKSLRDIKNVIP